MRVSSWTDALVTRAAEAVLEDRCTCHTCRCGCPRRQVRLLRVTDAVVLVDRCTCHACRCGCPRRQVHLLRVPLQLSTCTGARVCRYDCGLPRRGCARLAEHLRA